VKTILLHLEHQTTRPHEAAGKQSVCEEANEALSMPSMAPSRKRQASGAKAWPKTLYMAAGRHCIGSMERVPSSNPH
jgi:hypothetical protein